MSSLFTIFRKSKKLDHASILNEAMNELNSWSPDFTRVSVMENIGLGCHLLHTSPQSIHEESPKQYKVDNYTIVSISRLDYRLELANKLDIESFELNDYSDSKLILTAYQKWGEDCVKYLFGDFAFVIWDSSKNRMFCARDHFGTRPLYFLDNPEYFVVSSDIRAFRILPNFKLQLIEQYIVDALCAIFPGKGFSGFKDIKRLEPAHYLVYSSDQSLECCQYWDLELQDQFSKLSEREAIFGLRNRFIESVKQRCSSLNLLGVELSGGLDSSSIFSCLINEIKISKNVYTFSHVPSMEDAVDIPSSRDLHNLKIIMESCKAGKEFHINDDSKTGSISAISEALIVIQKPFVQGFSVMSDLLYKKANLAGVKVLFSGFGGDEGVTNQGSVLFADLVNRREFSRIRGLLNKDIQWARLKYYRRVIKYYVLILAPSLAGIRKKQRLAYPKKHFALNNILKRKYQVNKRFDAQTFVPKVPSVRKRQHHRIMHSYLLDRLENSYFNAEQNRIEYRYPFLDVKLIEYYYSLSSQYKYKNGIGRYVFREAMKGILNDRIRNRLDKDGATIPYLRNRWIKDEKIVRELINEGRNNNAFHYIDYNKLSGMIDQLMKDEGRKKRVGYRSLMSAISVLLLQKWQREGKIDVGIKC